LAFPSSAAAGFLSLAKEAAAQTVDSSAPNAQNLSLLEGFSSPSYKEAPPSEVTTPTDGTLVSAVGPLGTAADLAGENYASAGEISLYVVKEGDTLPEIAKMFGVSVNTIIWANDLSGNKIKAGDTLVILPIDGVQYEVQKGDTLESIAKKFGGDVDDIRRFNDLAIDAKLNVGDLIIIPDGEISAPPEPKPDLNLPSRPVAAGFFARPVLANFRKSQGFHGRYSAFDIAAPKGTPVLASAAGRVISAKDNNWNGGYGKMIVISHNNGTQTLYAHLSKVLVKVGDWVAQGALIGQVGSTGRSTGPHLHFEIRGTNPRPILTKLY